MKQNIKTISLFTTLAFIAVFSVCSVSLAETNSATNASNQNQAHGDYVRKHFLALMKKPFDESNQALAKTKVLVIGDSHAQDFLNSMIENNLLKHHQIRTRYIPTRCQIYLGDPSKRKWDKSDFNLCNKADSLEQAKSQIAEADIVILASMWRKWATVELKQTLRNLGLTKDKTLFVIGRRSFLTPKKEDIRDLSNQELKLLRKEVDIHQLDVNNLMKSTLDKNVFINVHEIVCGASSSCPVFTDNLRMISLDGGHLSKDGARYIGKILLNKSRLSLLTKGD